MAFMSAVRSRRERPAKPALSREWIVAETIKIMRAEGLEKVTMRRVAQALDTGPASLYVYVANTTELHTAVLDELMGSLRTDATDKAAMEGWRAELHAVLHAYSDVLFTYPGLARSALVLRPTGSNALRLYDRILALLLDGGVTAARAAWGVDLLLQRVTANAAEHSKPAIDEAPADVECDTDGLAAGLRGVDPSIAPHVAEHAEELLSGTPEQRTSWAIDALINGIASTPHPLEGAHK
jgi:AcrR family transcriptional regulator